MIGYDVRMEDAEGRFETGRVERMVMVDMQYPCLVFCGSVIKSSIEALRRIMPQSHEGERVWIYYEHDGSRLCLGGVLPRQVDMVLMLFKGLDVYGYMDEQGERLEGMYLYTLA